MQAFEIKVPLSFEWSTSIVSIVPLETLQHPLPHCLRIQERDFEREGGGAVAACRPLPHQARLPVA
ncbi:hypothetical protein CRG98_006970 [Punica granatum]|uniref:Uncharacterized protein n=1 Tax=Punica granatum TaxID=22663 RepID=A0A2I0KW55_PUNGR|nr:hypothetical protein CRG98_006970 [Punica granatum]